MSRRCQPVCVLGILVASGAFQLAWGATEFDGRYYAGKGDVEYLQLLDLSRRMFEPDPEYQNMPMLYLPAWNGWVEGPTWGAWWIQNSYGPTYCAIPFWQEPYATFLQNAQDLWFDQMGDGKRKGAPPPHDWVAPDGALCDAAAPGFIIYKQGDGRINIHDWGMEFTAAGLVMQAELLLCRRDATGIAKYLPKLERVANFIETRRDPNNNLFLAGAAGNLLAPSYAGWKKPDGTYDKAYLAGLSITYIAGLNRLIELEKLAGRTDHAALYGERRDQARRGLPVLMTEEGYFIKYLDPDGTKHGVYGAPKHGYFEAICNHDAMCFRVVDDAQAERIYAKIASIPGLRKYDLIITNCPSLDDIYEKPEGLWRFGHWVNGGHWSTCEARMIMAYYRLGKYEDARRSMQRIVGFARKFRMDNNLIDFGSNVYQPHQPINCVYDTWGVPAALIRGLFEYLYRADGLTILPHIPTGITELHQRFPIRFGTRNLYLSTVGQGPITAVFVNGQPIKSFDAKSVLLPYEETPKVASIQIALGDTKIVPEASAPVAPIVTPPPVADDFWTCDWTKRMLGPKPLPLRIGADSNGESRFIGDIDRARVFGRALKGDEIALLAETSKATVPNKDGLVGDWLVGSSSGREIANVAGSDLTAKVVGDTERVESPGGRALRLNGKGYLEVAHDPRLVLESAYTLEAWVRPKGLPQGGARIIDKSTVGTSDNFLLDTHPGNSLRLITRQGSLGFDAKLPVDQWSHVAATFVSGGELCLYVNGKRVASRSADHIEQGSTIVDLRRTADRIRRFHEALLAEGLGDRYEAAHARLVLEYVNTLDARRRLLAEGKIAPLAEPERQCAADRSFADTAAKLGEGLQKVLTSYKGTEDPIKSRIHRLWSGVSG